ncbi:vitellogenin-2-like [Homarus americanus]|uniref:vitellogenin-2-like n=1 Tax=Homarus americanus TaxID=6706 RepID=UPI001C46BF91|nr:vitellogenin-2-like [Homarus americanus]
MLPLVRSLVLALVAAGPVQAETLPHLFLSGGGGTSSSSSSSYFSYKPSSSSSRSSSSSSSSPYSLSSDSSYPSSSFSSSNRPLSGPYYSSSSFSSHRPSLSSTSSSTSSYKRSSSSSYMTSSSSYPSYKASSSSSYPALPSLPQPVPLVMNTARFVVVSEGQYDHAHHTHGREEDHEHREPHFATGNTSMQVFLGNTVTLDCTVHDMLNESVSWMRSVDDVLELITWDTHTYAKDSRYSLVRESGDRWHRWQLVIRRTQTEDQGQYRCQVATQPPLVLVVTLNVTEPVARVVDERGTKVMEKHYNSGSMIELKCIVEKIPFPHGPVTWRRGHTTLTYNTSRGGISVKGDANAGYIRSRLYVANAAPSDSGLYSCWYSNYTSDTVTVHVIAGENSQAMQHDGLPGSTSSTGGPPIHYHHYHRLLLPSFCLAALVLTCHNTRRLDLLLLFLFFLLLLLLLYTSIPFCHSKAVFMIFSWGACALATSSQGVWRRGTWCGHRS